MIIANFAFFRARWTAILMAALLGVALLGAGFTASAQTAAQAEPMHYFVVQADLEELKNGSGDTYDVGVAIEGVMSIIRRRLELSEAALVRLTHEGEGRLILETFGPDSVAQVEAVLGISRRLAFRLIDTSAVPAEVAQGILPDGSDILPFADGSPSEAVRRDGGIDGSQIIGARAGIDGVTHQSIVHISFDDDGTKRFAEMTSEHIGERIAIVLDGAIISAPVINEPILGGEVQISGNFTADTANELAIMLQSGALPAVVEIVEHRVLD
jgi:preprotein translocase subunit SecD